jgi:hypothetical protein
MVVSCCGKRSKKNIKIFVFRVGVGAELIDPPTLKLRRAISSFANLSSLKLRRTGVTEGKIFVCPD